jgi:hypothetical protein
MAVLPHPTYSPDLAPCNFSLFPRLKIKLKGHRFDTIEMIEAETQAVLTPSQNTISRMAEALELCIRAEGDIFEGDGGQ